MSGTTLSSYNQLSQSISRGTPLMHDLNFIIGMKSHVTSGVTSPKNNLMLSSTEVTPRIMTAAHDMRRGKRNFEITGIRKTGKDKADEGSTI
jgi:hypothetical protein